MKRVKFILCYLMIFISGSHFSDFYGTQVNLIYFVLSLLFLVFIKVKFNKGDLIFVAIFITSLLFFVLYTNSSYNYTSVLNLLFRFIYIYVFMKIIGSDFKELYIYVVVLLAVVSLVFFIGQLTGINNLFINYIPQYWQNDLYGHTRGGFLYVFGNKVHSYRNCGLFTEPGRYSIILNFSLYLLLYRKTSIKNNRKIVVMLVLFFSILTAQSTMGYLLFLVLVIFYLLFNKNNKGKYEIIFSIGLSLLGILLLIGYENIDRLFNSNFTNKLFMTSESSGLSGGTGGVRLIESKIDLEIFKNNILGVGYGNYLLLFNYYRKGIISETSSANAITSTLAIYGIFISTLIYSKIIRSFYKIKKNYIEFFVLILFFCIVMVSQNVLFSPIFVLFLFRETRNLI